MGRIVAQELFEDKKRKIEAAIGPDTALHAKKWAFLRSVLTNQDLRENPELVDAVCAAAGLALGVMAGRAHERVGNASAGV